MILEFIKRGFVNEMEKQASAWGKIMSTAKNTIIAKPSTANLVKNIPKMNPNKGGWINPWRGK